MSSADDVGVRGRARDVHPVQLPLVHEGRTTFRARLENDVIAGLHPHRSRQSSDARRTIHLQRRFLARRRAHRVRGPQPVPAGGRHLHPGQDQFRTTRLPKGHAIDFPLITDWPGPAHFRREAHFLTQLGGAARRRTHDADRVHHGQVVGRGGDCSGCVAHRRAVPSRIAQTRGRQDQFGAGGAGNRGSVQEPFVTQRRRPGGLGFQPNCLPRRFQ